MFLGCVAYMALQAQILAKNFTLISRDGTAHWGMLQMPVVFFALPLIVGAMGIGALIGWFVDDK